MTKWQPMETAPKDGSYILAVYKSLDGYALQLDGRPFAIRHEGKAQGGYDLGWSLFPGHGGVPDKCLSCWQPIDIPTPDCETCGGYGEVYGHSDDCGNDLCALAGGMDDCDGKIVECHCSTPAQPMTITPPRYRARNGGQ